MSKNGKIIGIAALVLAIAAVTFAVLSLLQAKKHARRYQELATAVAAMGDTLDSGKNINVSYSLQDGKEQGTLGWTSTKGLPGATANAVAPLEDLAQEVIQQREEIVTTIIEKVAKPLECPPAKTPNAEAVNNVNEYASSLNGLVQHIQARVNRDRNLQGMVNQVLGALMVRGRYNGTITDNGQMDAADSAALADATKNLNNLRGNYRAMTRALQELSRNLRSVQIDGVQWETPAIANTLGSTGLTAAETESNNNALGKYTSDLEKIKAQLQRVNDLQDAADQLAEELKASQAETAKWKEAWQKDEDAIKSFMDNVVPSGNYSMHALTSADQVNENVTGRVMNIAAEYGYVITSLTQGDTTPELLFSVYRGGKYIGMIRILSVTPYNSLAIVVNGAAKDIQVDDTLILASDTLQSIVK
jgi:chromosome segregation ATPase